MGVLYAVRPERINWVVSQRAGGQPVGLVKEAVAVKTAAGMYAKIKVLIISKIRFGSLP